MGEHNPTGYSASVRIWLSYGGQKIPLTHASSTFVIAREAIDLPPGDAEILFTIDDVPYTRAVSLVRGMSKDNREAMVLSRDPALPI